MQAVVVLGSEGNIIRSHPIEGKKDFAEELAKSIPQLAAKARSTIKDLDNDNELVFLRI